MNGPLPLLDLAPEPASFEDDVLAGLSKPVRELPSKYFYDAEGSRLFDRISELGCYYLTRVETAILVQHAAEMARELGPRLRLIELGTGSGAKTKLLLRQLVDPVVYVPVDISREHLLRAASELSRQFPALEVLPVCADYGRPLDLPADARSRRTVVFFPGSTIGNLHSAEATGLLARLRIVAGPSGGVLLGVDRKKDEEILLAAYDDAGGITAEFNYNLLRRINRELGADFDVSNFRHVAAWNAGCGRMESYLVSEVAQVVSVGRSRFPFAPGERLWTESSYKYDVADIERIAGAAGLRVRRLWSDSRDWFSLILLEDDASG